MYIINNYSDLGCFFSLGGSGFICYIITHTYIQIIDNNFDIIVVNWVSYYFIYLYFFANSVINFNAKKYHPFIGRYLLTTYFKLKSFLEMYSNITLVDIIFWFCRQRIYEDIIFNWMSWYRQIMFSFKSHMTDIL